MTSDAADLRRLAEQATPGPWRSVSGPGQSDYVVTGVDDYLTGPLRRYNAAYIAAANPQAILALISALESAEAKAESLLDERDQWREQAEIRVAALEEGLRRIADYDIGLPVEDESPIVFDYYRTIVRKARALLDAAPSEPVTPISLGSGGLTLPAEGDPWCRIDKAHTHGGTDEYRPHLFGSQRGKR